MDISSVDKLYLVILFIIPGFIGMKFYGLLVSGDRLDASKALVDALAFSCLNYAVFSWAIYWVQISELSASRPILYAAFWATVLFVGPVLCAIVLVTLRRAKFVARWLPHPTGKAWDYIFGTRECFYMIITLKSGKRVGATYGEGSFASNFPYDEQIYVEEVWDVDEAEGFGRRHFNSRGMLISGASIESIEFIGPHHESEQTKDDASAGDCAGRVSADAEEGVSTVGN
ncbi:DUF6338 family protein [Ralstonia pseudosolanacearum]|uniref:DUF6338 family protein n=1 Tax=Ralstonia pseudosolanacearum TaxID=1310165 RepID=UPI0012DAB6B4|nr:DUF6338 family protein [Ralstonia pseudosolanacearum]MDC6294139.1 DUF6338 family protein [Ralstonia pseudosolanacearum]MDD7788975.1 DUF6338 family protein [Ralstonia pseudosolanacearum]MDN3368115.1 DUF6338 family protein [Ralstonia pseudosolanacearum]QOK87210.1 hypothetical protein HF907_11550 [Ralstonia pseudosolanacearum]